MEDIIRHGCHRNRRTKEILTVLIPMVSFDIESPDTTHLWHGMNPDYVESKLQLTFFRRYDPDGTDTSWGYDVTHPLDAFCEMNDHKWRRCDWAQSLQWDEIWLQDHHNQILRDIEEQESHDSYYLSTMED